MKRRPTVLEQGRAWERRWLRALREKKERKREAIRQQKLTRIRESHQPARSPLEVFKAIFRADGRQLMREDEQGLPDQGDVNDLVDDVKRSVGDADPKLRVKCPGCGSKFPMALPDDVAVVPSDDDDADEEAADAPVSAQCPECSRAFGVGAPKGYKFRDAEGAAGDIACHDEAMKASEALVQKFLARYLGRPRANDGRTALEQFKESYDRPRRDKRLPALPPD
jgi:hypothetical protein